MADITGDDRLKLLDDCCKAYQTMEMTVHEGEDEAKHYTCNALDMLEDDGISFFLVSTPTKDGASYVMTGRDAHAKLFFNTCEGKMFSFNTKIMGRDRYKLYSGQEITCLRLRIPNAIARFQRRSSFRIKPDPAKPIVLHCRTESAEGEDRTPVLRWQANMFDISAGGISFLLNDPGKYNLQPRQPLLIVFELPNYERVLRMRVLVRSFHPRVEANNTQVIGCQFDLSIKAMEVQENSKIIEAYTMQRQLQVIRKKRGLE